MVTQQETDILENRIESEIQTAVNIAESGMWEWVNDLTKYVISEKPGS